MLEKSLEQYCRDNDVKCRLRLIRSSHRQNLSS